MRRLARPIGFEEVIREYGKIGIGYWCTHDTDVIPTAALGKDKQGKSWTGSRTA